MSVTFSPAIRAKFGNREYYITTMKAKHAAETIKQPNELFEVSAKSLDLRMQRELDKDKRVSEMASYLSNDYRFYGSLVIALKGGNPEFVPLEMSEPTQLIPLEDFALGVLRFSGTEEYFVIDGQHRLASIRTAIKNGNDAIVEDEVSLMIVNHEEGQAGIVNTRRLFTHLNRYAKKTTDSENYTIDEDDGYAIVTRRLVRTHPVLKDKIWYKSGNLPQGGKDGEPPDVIYSRDCFTTLKTVYNCNKMLLEAKHKFPKAWSRVRPEPELLDQLTEECTDLWDSICEIEPIGLLASGQKSCSEFRPTQPGQRGNGHVLFRPLGQAALAEAIVKTIHEPEPNFDGIGDICKACAKIDWRLSSPPWAGVFSKADGSMQDSNTRKRQSVGSKLLRYMLGVPWPSADPDLLQEYREVLYPSDSNSPEAKQLKLPPQIS